MEETAKSARPKNSMYRDIEEVAWICLLAQMGARPNSIRTLMPGDRWTDVKIGKVMKDQFGHGARHGRRPAVACVDPPRQEVVQRTMGYLFFDLLSPWAGGDAPAVIQAYEVYLFVAEAMGHTAYPIEKFIPFAQGAERQGLRQVSCKRCSVPRLVESFKIQSTFRCEACVERKGKRAAEGANVVELDVAPAMAASSG